MTRTLNDVQLVTADEFYRQIKTFVSNTVSYQARLQQFVQFMAGLTIEDLDAIGIPAAGADFGLRADLVTLRTGLNAIESEMALNEAIFNKFRTIITL